MSRRHNFFDFPHKPFRHMWMEIVSKIGNVNYTDDAALAELAKEIDFATHAYAHHNRDESEWFGERLKAFDADLAERWIGDHDHHLEVLGDFRDRIAAVQAEEDVAKRAEMIMSFYDYACVFLYDDLEHMHLEQNAIMKHFWDNYTDDELRAMEGQFIQERIDPEYLQSLTPLFLRAGNIDDRTYLISIVKEQTPTPEAFEGFMSGLAASIIPAAELQQIRARVEA